MKGSFGSRYDLIASSSAALSAVDMDATGIVGGFSDEALGAAGGCSTVVGEVTDVPGVAVAVLVGAATLISPVQPTMICSCVADRE